MNDNDPNETVSSPVIHPPPAGENSASMAIVSLAELEPASQPALSDNIVATVVTGEAGVQPSKSHPLIEKKFFVGNVSGIDVSIHYLLPIFWGIYVLWMGFNAVNRTIDNEGVDDKRSSEFWKGAWMGVLSCVLSLLAILGHALTQAFVARRCEGGSVDPIVLWPFGTFDFCASGQTVTEKAIIMASGSAFNLALFVPWWLFSLIADTNDCKDSPLSECFMYHLFCVQMSINLLIAGFNLFVPIYPLDASKILAAFLSQKSGMAADRAVKFLGAAGLTMLIALAALSTGDHLQSVMAIFIVLWGLAETYRMYIMYNDGKIAEHPVFKGSVDPSLP